MLMPKRVKYRKPHSAPYIKGVAKRGTTIAFGEFGLKALEPRWVSARQLEASRVAITRYIKKGGKLWMRVFPDKAVTKHPAETRMGKGKGAPEYWAAVVKPGRVLFEIQGIPEDQAREAFLRASHKLPIKTKFIIREEI
ncbi:MAG: 50S ribosomal protein L16 [Elusimicrobia bacterium]|nr:50S ribosomal protein L16 [Elusimicrobiota bacterium]MBI5594967.1 50S ribosomal protein L16 [Elusimicrobiota bacterium]